MCVCVCVRACNVHTRKVSDCVHWLSLRTFHDAEGTFNRLLTASTNWQYCSSGMSLSFLVRGRERCRVRVLCEGGEGEVSCEGVV